MHMHGKNTMPYVRGHFGKSGRSGTFVRGILHRWGLDLHLLDQVVLLGVFLQLVAHRAHDIFNLVREELVQRVYGDRRWQVTLFILNFLLLVKDYDDLGVVVPVLLRALAIVQVDQHVRQILMQAALNVVSVLSVDPVE